MPLNSAPVILALILAAFGGLLLLFFRRPRAAFAARPDSNRTAPDLRLAMQAPEATAGNPPGVLRSVSGTPFPPVAQGELILLIDDEASVRDLLGTVLLNHGYRVAVARDGEEGLRLFSAEPDRVSLVLSDVNMPKVCGKSFAELIRPIRPDIRILFMSGLDGSQNGTEAEHVSSRDPFLHKPFRPAALLAKIHNVLHPDVPL